MLGVKNPKFLVIPAYFLGLAVMLFCATAMPLSYGTPLAAVLCLFLLTPLSLLHPHIYSGAVEDEIILHVGLYAICLALGMAFAYWLLPVNVWPVTRILQQGMQISWLQVAFVAVQQALYFGLHAFR